MIFGIENMDNETIQGERPHKKWFIIAVNSLKQRLENNITVPFKINYRIDRGFIVKSHGLNAFVRFSDMPWNYKNPSFWDVVLPSLAEKSFVGYVAYFTEEPLAFGIRADRSQFDSLQFQYEIDEVYTAIVLKKTNSCLWLDFGYGLDWQYGSLPFTIDYYFDDENMDWFPYYNTGDEFRALYVGKSVSGNDIFGYDGTRYYSEEYKLVGQKIWVNLERTKSGYFCFLTQELYVGKLLLDEEDDLDTSYKFLQKILQTLPNGQRLWCKVVGITLEGTLHLKWLVDAAPPIEDVLSLYVDASILRTNDPLLSEEKKGLINKKVWCQPCEEAYPRRFKIENQYFGTISIDANLYQDIPLSLVLNTLEKIPDNQHIFCKIKGVYPDGTFKLQWIVQWDVRAKTLVFPNKFSHKIKLEISEKEKKLALVGKETWGIIRDSHTNKKIVLIKGLYPTLLMEENVLQNGLLQYFPPNTKILCKVLELKYDGRLQIKWLLPESFTPPDTMDISPMTQLIGKEIQAEIKWFILNKPIFLIEGKYVAEVIYKGIAYAKYISQLLQKLQEGQQILCRILDVNEHIVHLEWPLENDPDIYNLPLPQIDLNCLKKILEQKRNNKDEKTEKRKRKRKEKEKEEKEQSQKKKAIAQEEQTQVLIGQETWGRIIQKYKKRITFMVEDIYPAILEEGYPFHKKLLLQFIKATIISCKIVDIEEDGRLRIKWIPPQPLTLPDTPDEIPIEQRIGEKVWAEIKWFFPHKPMALIEGKYPAVIRDNSFEKAKLIKKIVKQLPEGEKILCRIKNIKEGIIVLDWLFGKDTIDYSLFLSQQELEILKNRFEQKIKKEDEHLIPKLI